MDQPHVANTLKLQDKPENLKETQEREHKKTCDFHYAAQNSCSSTDKTFKEVSRGNHTLS